MSKANNQKQNVFVGLSGGVDSSVTAYLLQKKGYAVTGVFMRCFNIDGCAERDAEDAHRVAEHLNIPFYVFDFEEEYKKRVVEYMINGYEKGHTPNPDVMCNKEIKFNLFLREALAMGADYMATGHYCRLRRKSQSTSTKTKTCLYQAKDKNKDQSYFLWTLTQKQLQHCLFPLGNLKKEKVRQIAKHAGLPTWNKKDSQGICFLGKVALEDFLKTYIPPKEGDIKDTEGNKIGKHNGAWYYTTGQRHGLNLGSKNKELRITGKHKTKPHYVVSKDIKTNTVVVAEGRKNPAMETCKIELENLNFLDSSTKKRLSARSYKLKTRIRYRQSLQKARLIIRSSKFVILKFDHPVKFVAPGQSAVLYSKQGELLGGGVIIGI